MSIPQMYEGADKGNSEFYAGGVVAFSKSRIALLKKRLRKAFLGNQKSYPGEKITFSRNLSICQKQMLMLPF